MAKLTDKNKISDFSSPEYADNSVADAGDVEGQMVDGGSKPGWLKKNFVYVLLLLVVALGASTFYFYRQYSVFAKDSQALNEKEVKSLVAQVGKLVVLPEGEDPTVATVTEPEKLRDQPFFSKSQKGDKVLIYSNAKKAILYNPTTNKIVEVAPISIGK
ncbi:MAG: hypothetical protein Q7S32_03340 [bacterium]|nr:hypothetical protein [bacterium]